MLSFTPCGVSGAFSVPSRPERAAKAFTEAGMPFVGSFCPTVGCVFCVLGGVRRPGEVGSYEPGQFLARSDVVVSPVVWVAVGVLSAPPWTLELVCMVPSLGSAASRVVLASLKTTGAPLPPQSVSRVVIRALTSLSERGLVAISCPSSCLAGAVKSKYHWFRRCHY